MSYEQRNATADNSQDLAANRLTHSSIAGGAAIDSRDADVIEVVRAVWKSRWQILAVTITFSVLALLYSFIATPWYRAQVVIVPASDTMATGLAAQFGGLASLAGIRVGDASSVEPIAVLRSRDLATAFIRENDLLPIFFADQWDAQGKRWKPEEPEDWPDLRDAVTFFDENIRFVAEEAKSGIITVHVEWTDAELAARWANDFVDRVDAEMRNRARREAERNIRYLKNQLSSTEVVALQRSVSDLLQSELQKLMLAEGEGDFAFRVIDHAEIPKYPASPKRLLLVVAATALGMLCALLTLYFRLVLTGGRTRR